MNKGKNLQVAIPWNLNHYLKFHGFHPRYQALFDAPPKYIQLKVWDREALQQQLIANKPLYQTLSLSEPGSAAIDAASFWKHLLTSAMAGDIEFHHTCPYPSMLRPFIFHCENFETLLSQNNESHIKVDGHIVETEEELHQHYQQIFSSNLCLGIFSHQPETLSALSSYCKNLEVDKKLYLTSYGLSASCSISAYPTKPNLSKPRFIFINSASQAHEEFFTRGGHLVLQFWQEFLETNQQAMLFLRCSKPSDNDLLVHGVNLSFINSEIGNSIIWVEQYLTHDELNSLIASTHFFFLPSTKRHNTSIMTAMTLGSVPIVLKIPNQLSYLNKDNCVKIDFNDTGFDKSVLINKNLYQTESQQKDIQLVTQMITQIRPILDAPSKYQSIQRDGLIYAQKYFSGRMYSIAFWDKTKQLYLDYCKNNKCLPKLTFPITFCGLSHVDIRKSFESPQFLLQRIYTGNHQVYEFLGLFACIPTDLHPANSTQYLEFDSDSNISIKNTLQKLNGCYIHSDECGIAKWTFRGFISRLLMPFPSLHQFVHTLQNTVRKYLVLFIKLCRKPIGRTNHDAGP